MASATSSGGAAGAIGVGLQDRVFAWAAARMLAEETLPNQLGVPGKVIMVGAQTGHALDDVGVHTDADAYALFQVKAGLGLGTAEDSPLAEAIGQAVEQYAVRPIPFGDQGPQRIVEPGRDALVSAPTSRRAPPFARI